MKRLAWIFGAALLSACAAAPRPVKSALGVKTGLWNVSHGINERESSKIPQEFIDRMTPEQRAHDEQSQRDQAMIPAVRTTPVCVTQTDLDAGMFNAFIGGANDGCSATVIRASAVHQEVHILCPSGGKFVPLRIVTLEVLSDESVRAKLVVPNPNGRSVSDLSGQWKGAECAAPATDLFLPRIEEVNVHRMPQERSKLPGFLRGTCTFGGGGGTVVPSLSRRPGLCLHPSSLARRAGCGACYPNYSFRILGPTLPRERFSRSMSLYRAERVGLVPPLGVARSLLPAT